MIEDRIKRIQGLHRMIQKEVAELLREIVADAPAETWQDQVKEELEKQKKNPAFYGIKSFPLYPPVGGEAPVKKKRPKKSP